MTIKLDNLDQKILLVLMRNGRVSTTELAKTIHHSYGAVWKRMNKLIDTGVIRHTYPVVQYPGIGARRYMSIYLRVKNATTEKQQEIFKELCKSPFIIEVYELDGKWNVGLMLVTNYLKDARDTLQEIRQIASPYITDLICMPLYTTFHLNRRFFTDLEVEVSKTKTGYYPLIMETPLIPLSGPLKLNEKDKELLDYIKLNGRASLEEIGKAIKRDPKLVDYKLKKMISDNLIRRFMIEIDSSKIGYEQYLLFLDLGGSEEAKNTIITEINQMKEAYHYFEYLNYWELVIIFTVKNRAEMSSLFNKLQEKYRSIIKNHEVVWLSKKWKVEPYPDVKRVYREKM